MSKNSTGERRSGLTGTGQVVGRLVGDAQEAQDRIKAEAEGRDGHGKPGNSGEVGRDSWGRYKISADVTPGRRGDIEKMSVALGVSKSDIVDAALANMVTLFEEGRINLDPYKVYVPNEKQPGKGGIKLILPRLFKFF